MRLVGDRVEVPWLDLFNNMLTQEAGKAGWVVGINAHILVHVKDRDLRPVDPVQFAQGMQKAQLRIARG